MRVDLVKSSIKALISASEDTLVDGMVIADKIPQWSIAQLSTSIFTVPRFFPFYGVYVAPAESFIDASRAQNMRSASSVATLPTSSLYDVTIRVVSEGKPVSGEGPGKESEQYETVSAMHDLLVARTVLMLRDNAEFASAPSGFTLKLETEYGRSDTQRIRIEDYSDLVVWGDGGSQVAVHIADIKFRLETCGEPRAYAAS